MIVFEISAIVFLFFLFAASHTLLASIKIKTLIAKKIGNKIAMYRAFYNASSLIFFFAFYELSPKPDVIVYDLLYPFDIITFALQVLSIIGFIWAVKPISLKEFAGISQIKKYLSGNYNPEDLDEKMIFKIQGAYKIVRHPVYLFSILFLSLRPTMSLFYFVMLICIIVYFYIGSIYEEKKLITLFGVEYINYQKNVPRIIPWKLWRG